MSSLQAIKYERGKLEVLDQLRLPHEFHYDIVASKEDAFDCIKSMRVRGAPAIAIVASLALAVELLQRRDQYETTSHAVEYIGTALDYLKTSRPTAVDLTNAIIRLKKVVSSSSLSDKDAVIDAFISEAETILEQDLRTNLAIGDFGASWLRPLYETGGKVSVLTHCNTGSLATSGHGTALGIIRSLWTKDMLRRAFCTETRPYNQGSRLTSFELVYEKIPSTLITDSMAGALFSTMKEKMNVAAVIVGADRVVRNGDTANKVGTYALAVLARHHGIKFIVAAPTTSVDLSTETGAGIKIEERKKEELTQVTGPPIGADGEVLDGSVRVATADQRIDVWNPAFDVTPHELIDVIVTEKGLAEKDSTGQFDLQGLVK